jgi:hypothetical protein
LTVCARELPCGHACVRLCHAAMPGACTPPDKCREKVPKRLLCGHTAMLECGENPLTAAALKNCREPCDKPTLCGHPCRSQCGKCSQVVDEEPDVVGMIVAGPTTPVSRAITVHVPCAQKCERPLVCTHPGLCRENCVAECPPCKERCPSRCLHSECKHPCGAACPLAPCAAREPCLWRCEHLACTRLCGQPCNREPCEAACTKMLKCGHPCIGLCGDECPKRCRVCCEERGEPLYDLTLLGDEDEPGARFVELKDCGHVFEVSGIDGWVRSKMEEMRSGESVAIMFPVCPLCKTPIRRTLRYNAAVNTVFADVSERAVLVIVAFICVFHALCR